jgi:hypothetical protein
MLEILAWDEPSSLLQTFVNYEQIKFYNGGHRAQSYITICRVTLKIILNFVTLEIQAQNSFTAKFMLGYKSVHGKIFILLSF